MHILFQTTELRNLATSRANVSVRRLEY